MPYLRFLFAAFLILFHTSVAHADIVTSETVSSEMTTTRLISDVDAITPGEPFLVALEFDLKGDWHTYWKNPGDSGIPTSIAWTLPEGFRTGPIHWPAPERTDMAGILNFAYHDRVSLLVPVIPPESLDEASYSFKAKADWLVCDDICIPESANYTLTLPAGDASDTSYLSEAKTAIPGMLPTSGHYELDGDTVQLSIPLDVVRQHKGAKVDSFPVTEGFVSNREQLNAEWQEDALVITLAKDALQGADIPAFSLLVIFEQNGEKHSYEIDIPSIDNAGSIDFSNDKEMGLALAILFAFLGGIILNAMPCVLPILSLKLMALVGKSSASRNTAARHGIAYTLGIMLSFGAVAGVLIALQQAGQAVGWGFQLQSPVFVTALAAILFLVGLNLSGVFSLPHLFGNVGQKLTEKDSPRGSFFTGVLATLVATPCTAPLMAPALGFALTQPPIASLTIFAALGLGFALPLLIVSLFPSMLRFIPKPGVWMETFKQFLAFPIYATVAWLLWVLVIQGGEAALANALIILLVLALITWLYGHTHRPAFHVIAKILTLGLVVWIIYSFAHMRQEDMITSDMEFDPEMIETLRSEGKPVFVDATAAWCITCKLNELSSLSSDEVKEHFKERGITFIVADWTNRNATISAYLKSFGRQGVPLYVYYPENGGEPRVLPQLLTPSIVIDSTMD